MKIKCIALMIALFIVYSFNRKQQVGRFIGTVVAEWLDSRKMQLVKDFAYEDPKGKIWKAPKKTIIDGASIPKIFWTTIGGPFEGEYRNASVIHDSYCLQPYKDSWQNVHKMFYDACITGGVSQTKAKIMYAAVYFGGPRWKTFNRNKRPGNRVVEVTQSYHNMVVEDSVFNNIENWIKTTNPDLQKICDTLDKISVVDKISINEVEKY